MNFKWFLGAVFVVFVGIMIATWAVARHAHPVLLDERGNQVDPSHGH
jgi:hypothetical protein